MDYVKSPPRFLLHFVLGGLLFYLQLEARREGKNQRWFRLGLLLTTLVYFLICALPTVLAFIWRRHGNLSICQLCGGFWLPYYYEARPQPQQQLDAVHQAQLDLTVRSKTRLTPGRHRTRLTWPRYRPKRLCWSPWLGSKSRSRTIPRQGRGAVAKRCRVWLGRCDAFWTATVI
ncbi:hypothetical protein MRB53_012427 [Persea americana]|uniref:Uncharacterized protein n=1 Tax=Persea americana TaxID=3435 RepID=A0ACC2LXN3_PERAE|nr:hypothetical protein MRB53_012427 [Persea americana]